LIDEQPKSDDPADANEAFRGTFLVLAHKAATVARREVVGAWLQRVLYRG
jgi:hypothetical protein